MAGYVFALRNSEGAADFVVDDANDDAGDEVLDKETDCRVGEVVVGRGPVLNTNLDTEMIF